MKRSFQYHPDGGGPLDGGGSLNGEGPLDGGHTPSAFNKHLFLPLQPSPERVASDLLRSRGESGLLGLFV